ncbi:Uncharacterised protein [Mycobacteroides abscessus subsp. abscessus]|nr:Uncharacterised protein [Mycobacteroides abscessus subsp. abscessus]
MDAICRNAAVPSCIRVPPDAGRASTGSRSRVARRTAPTTRSPAARPIDPPRNPNSLTTNTIGAPEISPTPVITDSSTPVRLRARPNASA